MLLVNQLCGFGAFAGGGELAASLDFESGSSQYLSRTEAAATDMTKMTFSVWIKRETVSVTHGIISGQTGINNNPSNLFIIDTSGTIVRQIAGNYGLGGFYTTPKVNDTNWHHICVNHDAAQTSTDKTKVWIDGTQVTTFDFEGRSGWVDDQLFSGPGDTYYLGRTGDGSAFYFDGLLADIIHVDGTAYPASTFGIDNSGTWTRRKQFASAITYGANGHRINGSGAVGADFSGNGNNFTNTNSVTTSVTVPPEI